MNDLVKVKDRIEFLTVIREAGYTRRSLAEVCGVHYTSLAYYITGKRNPGYNKAKEIANTVGKPFDELFVHVARVRGANKGG